MVSGLLITIREGTEAFLIVGILLVYLDKIGQQQFKKHIWWGTFAAMAASLFTAWGFQALAVQFEGNAAVIFEIVVSLIAIVVLTYMILWMQHMSHNIKKDLEGRVNMALSSKKVFALAGLAFVSVLREGLETALFLAALFSSSGGSTAWGAFFGLAIAALIGYVIFKTTVKLNLGLFFKVTGILIVFIAAGLVGHTVSGLVGLGVIPAIIPQVWNLNGVIDEESVIGRLLHAFIGYDANPSLMWLIGYTAYVYYFGSRFFKAGTER